MEDYGSTYKMYLQTVQGTAIKALIESLKELIFETNIVFEKDEIRLTNIEQSHHAMVVLKLHASEFEQYYCPKQQILGIFLPDFHKLLKTIGNNDTLALYVTHAEPDVLGIHIQNKKKRIDNNIFLNLRNYGLIEFSLPVEESNVAINIPCGEFQKYCRELSNISEIVDIEVSKDGVFSMLTEAKIAKQRIDMISSEESNVNIQIMDDQFNEKMGSFSLKLLNLFCKSSTIGNTLQLLLKNDYPMMLVYQVASLGSCTYCLFPVSQSIKI